MKRRLLTTVALAATMVISTIGIAFAAATIGNPAIQRATVDSYSNFTIVDTNNSATYDGTIAEVEYFAHRPGTVRFVIADADGVITGVSDPVTAETAGPQTATIGPLGITVGSDLGVYSAGAGVVSFDYDTTAGAAYYTANNVGMPAVGQTLAVQGASARVYSMNATVIPAAPATKDACKNGGWEAFSQHGFRNQGECVASLMANEESGK